jgi:hypothetical protein
MLSFSFYPSCLFSSIITYSEPTGEAKVPITCPYTTSIQGMQMHSHKNSAQEGKNTTVRTPTPGQQIERINSARVWADEIGRAAPIQNLEGKQIM